MIVKIIIINDDDDDDENIMMWPTSGATDDKLFLQ